MGCERFVGKDGSVGFICSRGSKTRQCEVPGCYNRAQYLCDYPLSGKLEWKTCDKHLCSSHVKLIKYNVHYCLPHFRKDQKEKGKENV